MRASHTFLSSALMAFALAGCETFAPNIPPAQQIEQDQTNLSNERNVIVLVRTQQQANTLLVNAARRGYQLNKRSDMESLELIMLDFERPKGVSGEVAISDMKTMEPSATAGLDHSYTYQSDNVVSVSTPRLYARSMLAWPEGGCQTNLSIGMIDGDVDTSSTTLQNTKIIEKDFTDGNTAAKPHGTAIAELLVGAGRLQGAELYSASVVTYSNAGKEGAGIEELANAIAWMHASNVQLVNISLAGPYNMILDRVVQRASAKGMVFVAAVGNDGPEAPPRYPAAFENVIAVTAIDSARNIYSRAVRGDHVDFSAPGVDVFVNDGARAQYLSGTSVAAPFVTAMVASQAELSPEDNANTIKARMASFTEDLGQAGVDPVFGLGLVRSTGRCSTPVN